jgi:hypothetical protein
MKAVGIFCGHLVYFVAIWYIMWPFGICYGYLVSIFLFLYFVTRKIWQPWLADILVCSLSLRMQSIQCFAIF